MFVEEALLGLPIILGILELRRQNNNATTSVNQRNEKGAKLSFGNSRHLFR